MIITYTSPSFDALAERCIDFLAGEGEAPARRGGPSSSSLGDAFAEALSAGRDPVVVYPSIAAKDALTRAWAERRGAAAGIDWRTFSGLLAPATGGDVADDLFGERAAWRLYEILSEAAEGKASSDGSDAANGQAGLGSPRLRAFLAGRTEAERWTFARRMKELFTQYATFRRDWLAAWLAGKDLPDEPASSLPDWDWERALFLALRERGFSGLDALIDAGPAIEREAAAFCAGGSRGRARRLAVFLPASLPPLADKLLDAMSRAGAEIRVFLRLPAALAEASDAADAAEAADEAAAGASAPLRFFDSRLALLRRLRAVGRVEALPAARPLAELVSNLAMLQRALAGATEAEAKAPSPDGIDYDETAVFLCASSLQRELEAFADRLEALFRADPSLRLHDVVMLFPNLDEAASTVHAVFGARRLLRDQKPSKEDADSAASSPLLLPYAVAGARSGAEDAFSSALIALASLALGKCTAQDLFEWLSLPAALEALSITRDDLDVLRDWLSSAGFLYGIDAHHLRAAAHAAGDAAVDDDMTLEAAVERLAAGAALPTGARAAAAPDLLPTVGTEWGGFEDVTRRPALLRAVAGVEAALSALAAAFFDNAGEPAKRAFDPPEAGPAPDAWRPIFEALADFLGRGDSSHDGSARFHLMTAALADDLRERPGRAGGADEVRVPAAAVLDALEERAAKRAGAAKPQDVIAAGPLRDLAGLPAKVAGVFGLDGGCGFPRQPKPLEWDLLAASKALGGARPADRDPAAEDRAAFADVVFGAGKLLHLSHSLAMTAKGEPADDPSPVLRDFERLADAAADRAGGLRNLAEALPKGGFPTVMEAPAAFDRRAFLSGLRRGPNGRLTLDGAAAAVGAPLRSWRSADKKLCSDLAAAGRPRAGARPTRPTGPVFAALAHLGERADGALDLALILRFLRQPADVVAKALGLERPDADAEADPFATGGESGGLSAWQRFARAAALRRSGLSREAIEAEFAADPKFGAPAIRHAAAGGAVRRELDALEDCGRFLSEAQRSGAILAKLRLRIPVPGGELALEVPQALLVAPRTGKKKADQRPGLVCIVGASHGPLPAASSASSGGLDWRWRATAVKAALMAGHVEGEAISADAGAQAALDASLQALQRESAADALGKGRHGARAAALLFHPAHSKGGGKDAKDESGAGKASKLLGELAPGFMPRAGCSLFEVSLCAKSADPAGLAMPADLFAAAASLFLAARRAPAAYLIDDPYRPGLAAHLRAGLLPDAAIEALEADAQAAEDLRLALQKAAAAIKSAPDVRAAAIALAARFIERIGSIDPTKPNAAASCGVMKENR